MEKDQAEAQGQAKAKQQAQANQQYAVGTDAVKASSAQVTPESLAKWIGELSWKRPADKETAELLVAKMDGEYDSSIIVRAVWVWHCFADESTLPQAAKPAAYCAAVEYLMSEAHELPATQKGIAAKYGISPTTLSRKNKELTAFFDERAAAAEQGEVRQPAMV